MTAALADPVDAAWIGVALFEAIWSAERHVGDTAVRALLFRLAGERAAGGAAALLSFMSLLIEHGMTIELSGVLEDVRGASGESDWLVAAIDVKLAQVTGHASDAVSAARALLAQPCLPLALRGETHVLLGEALREQGHHQEARRCYRDALALSDPLTDLSASLTASCKLADLAYVYGDLDDATRLLAEARKRAEDVRPTEQPIAHLARIYRLQGQICHVRGEVEAAVALFRRSLEIALSLHRPRLIAEAYNSLAEAEIPIDSAAALVDVGAARAVAAHGTANLEYGKSLLVECEVRLRQGDAHDARWLADKALATLTRVGYGSGIARAQRARAEALLALGQGEDALTPACDALAYYRRENVYPSLRLSTYDLALRCARACGQEDAVRTLDDPRAIPNLDQFPQFTSQHELSG